MWLWHYSGSVANQGKSGTFPCGKTDPTGYQPFSMPQCYCLNVTSSISLLKILFWFRRKFWVDFMTPEVSLLHHKTSPSLTILNLFSSSLVVVLKEQYFIPLNHCLWLILLILLPRESVFLCHILQQSGGNLFWLPLMFSWLKPFFPGEWVTHFRLYCDTYTIGPGGSNMSQILSMCLIFLDDT